MSGRPVLGVWALLLVAACSAPQAAAQTSDPGLNRVGATVYAAADRPMLPTVSGPTLAGGELDLTSLRGHVVVLNVWASWCAPCKAESPALVGVARATTSQGVVFVGIDENDQGAPAKAFLAGINSNYTNLVDPDGTLLAHLRFLPQGIPSSLVIDPQGRVAARVIGPTTAAQMTALVSQVLSGK